MTTSAPPLLMTMSDIAALARVQRPVVSVWRSRTAATGMPFPVPAAHAHGQDLFDAALVGSWLADTGRGNNPDAAADAAAHATPSRDAQTTDVDFPAITALLTLRSQTGGALSALTPDDLLDAADEHDPDDDLLYREIEGMGDDRAQLVQYVDDAVEAGYGEAAVFDRLVAEHLTGARRHLTETTLSTTGLDLMSHTTLALANTRPAQGGDPVIVDLLGSSTDTLIAIANLVDDLTVVTTNTNDESGRLQRRRLTVHRIPHTTISHAEGPLALHGSAVHGNSVHIIGLPAVDDPAASPLRMLLALDRIMLQMNTAELAVVLAPSAVLSDGSLHRDADQVRSDLLRSGRVRAIVRLPVGLRPRKPRQAQTLWIVGETRSVVLAERWTMVADLSAVHLDPGAITDLVNDLVASLGDLATVRAHAFRFARLVLTRTLLASRDSLVVGAHRAARQPTKPGAALAVRVEGLLGVLNSESSEFRLMALTVEPKAHTGAASVSSVEQQIAAGHLRYIRGNRLNPGDITEGITDAAGIRIIGPAEVFGERPLGHRHIDRLRFAGQYPAGRVTEAGDVVFCTSPRPAAIVDTEGTSVVAFPARILRIDRSDPNGLLSEVLAADIAAVPAIDKQWKSWPLRQSDHRQRGPLADALASIRVQQEQAHARLTRLDELSALLMRGITAGTMTLTTAQALSAPPEGTH